ncbi:MAG: NAD(P)/FAD-dependent oxidoreductase [Candidatus Desulfatibia sp.]|uniref:geranylgeranyl reductase family protein n=1 Tax=Candidatus Desulfatibia sp. TaxID=3101189 RepID=UPI002F30F44D
MKPKSFSAKVYDAAIIGGGPAGSSAACVLADAGFSTVVIDKRKRIGYPVQCAEFIHRAGYDGPREFISQPILEMVTHLPDGSVHRSKSPGYTIHRDLYDAFLAEKAKNRGVEFLLRCEGRIAAGSLTINYGASKTLNAKTIINASGPRAADGAIKAISRQVTLPLDRPLKDIHVWMGKEFTGGYAWLFPKGELANVGVAVSPTNGRPDLKEILDNFVGTIQGEFQLGARPLRVTGGKIPLSGVTSLLEGKVLTVGDAAGITHPVSGEGIYRAVISGRMAAGAVVAFLQSGDIGDLKKYPSALLGIYEKSFQRDKRKRQMWRESFDRGGPTSDEYRALWIGFPEYYAPAHYEAETV